MHYTVVKAETSADFAQIEALAQKIWHCTYDALIGPEQVDYMVQKFQSQTALQRDVEENGYEYSMAFDAGRLIGYCGVHPEDRNFVFLSKVYVDPDYQKMGIAKSMVFSYVKKYADLGFKKMWLTVNKGNENAIAAYLKLGFVRSGELLTDIGNGYVMVDYTMELNLTQS